MEEYQIICPKCKKALGSIKGKALWTLYTKEKEDLDRNGSNSYIKHEITCPCCGYKIIKVTAV